MAKNRIVKNKPSYCESSGDKAAYLRRLGYSARKQRSDAGTKRK